MNIIDFRHQTKFDPKQSIKTRDTSIRGVIKKIIIHATDAPSWSPTKLSNFFVDERKFPCCSYHFYAIGNNIYHMVGENLVTYHAAGNNSESIGVAMDFQPTVAENLGVKIDETVYKNTIIFVAALCVKYSLLPTEVYGHREQILLLQGRDKHCNTNLRKTCPGLSIDLDEDIKKALLIALDNVNFCISELEM